MIRLILLTFVLLTASPALAQTHPLIIAHRGASGERPEHTRAAYERAIDQGADYIEPDLVMTRDGVLVARHENEISGTTDVASHPAYADRRTAKVIDGETVTGWFTEDFTLAELKTLRARERLPAIRPANTAFDGQEPILTFDEVLDIAGAATARTGRVIGVAPELKHPSYFAALGLPMEPPLIRSLGAHGLLDEAAPVLIQCFEIDALRALSHRIFVPLLQLIAASGGPVDHPERTYASMITPEGLAEIRTYADWIGVDVALIEPAPGGPTSLIDDAHAASLDVAGWTFRAENRFLPEADRLGADPLAHGRLRERLARFKAYGLDAAFTDHPARLVAR